MPSSLQEISFNLVFRFWLDNAQFARERQLINHWFCGSLAYFVQFLFAVTSVTLQNLSMKLHPLVRTLASSMLSCSESEKCAVKEAGIQWICAPPFMYSVCRQYMHERSLVKDSNSCHSLAPGITAL